MKWQDLLALSLIGGSALADGSKVSDVECHSPACLTSRSNKNDGLQAGRGAAHASGSGDIVVTDSGVTPNQAYAHGSASGNDASVMAQAEISWGPNHGNAVPQGQCSDQGACQIATCDSVKLEKHANNGRASSTSSHHRGSTPGGAQAERPLKVSAPGTHDDNPSIAGNSGTKGQLSMAGDIQSGSPSGGEGSHKASSPEGHANGPQFGSPNGQRGDIQSGARGGLGSSQRPNSGLLKGGKVDSDGTRDKQSVDQQSASLQSDRRQGDFRGASNVLATSQEFNQFTGGACSSGMCLLGQTTIGGEMQPILNNWVELAVRIIGEAQSPVPAMQSDYETSPAELRFPVMSNFQCSYGSPVNVFGNNSPNTGFTISAAAAAGVARVSVSGGQLSGQGPIDIFAPLVNRAQHRFELQAADVKLPAGTMSENSPIATNKFHTNMIVGEEDYLSYAGAYGVAFARGKVEDSISKAPLVGLSLQHFPEKKHLPDNSKNAIYNFPDALELVIGAKELVASEATFGTSKIRSMSLLATIAEDESHYIEFPIVQGMGFVTAIYRGGMTPKVTSKHQILRLSRFDADKKQVQKFKVELNNGVLFLIYASRPFGGSTGNPKIDPRSTDDLFTLDETSNEIVGLGPEDALVLQIAKSPEVVLNEAYYDKSAGSYVTNATVLGTTIPGEQATYKIDYLVEGLGEAPLIFAMPHMITSLDDDTKNKLTGIKMSSGVKGEMTGVMSYSLIMHEKFAKDLLFGPWANGLEQTSYDTEQLEEIEKALKTDLALEVADAVTKESNTYFAAKVLSRHALVLATADMIRPEASQPIDLEEMKKALKIFTSNTQKFPIHYDTIFKGIVPAKPQFEDAKDDVEYGSWLYANHNYHYGYLIHAAAVVGYLDSKAGGSWLQDNMEYFNVLVKDVSTPTEDDSEFPFSRSFDWFAGHSWATGARESADGQVQASAGEDVHFAYAMKLWGKVTGDVAMEARGDLTLAVLARSLNQYHFFASDDAAYGYGKYKVAGLMFHNKLAYETYFGNNPEFIHGAHMLPVTPATAFVRSKDFAAAEWKAHIEPVIKNADKKWQAILNLNRALFDPMLAYTFFKDIVWKADEHDQGQSKSWALAYTGALMSWNKRLSNGDHKPAANTFKSQANPTKNDQGEGSSQKSTGKSDVGTATPDSDSRGTADLDPNELGNSDSTLLAAELKPLVAQEEA